MDVPISIVMSVYNGEGNVEETIESMLNQSFKNFEFIIVDDASTDGTYQILEEYRRKDSRIVLLRNDSNMGLTKSLNKAINYAQGRYIARIDAGDISLPQRLQKQFEYMESHQDVGLLGTAIQIVYRLRDQDEFKKTFIYPETHEEVLRMLRRKNPFGHVTVMFKKDLFLSVGGYDESFVVGQDHELWTRMVQKTRVHNLRDVLVIAPMHSQSITIANNNRQLINGIRLCIRKIRRGICPWYYFIYILKNILLLIVPNTMRASFRVLFYRIGERLSQTRMALCM